MLEADPHTIRIAAAGDHRAFESLVRTYQEPVVRFLTHLLSDRTLADDVAQETFLRCYQKLNGYSFEGRFSTWLLRVAHNAGIDAYAAGAAGAADAATRYRRRPTRCCAPSWSPRSPRSRCGCASRCSWWRSPGCGEPRSRRGSRHTGRHREEPRGSRAVPSSRRGSAWVRTEQPMRCRDAGELLSAGLDDELVLADVQRLERHVDRCESCQATRAAYNALRTRLRVTQPIAVDLVPALRANRLSGRPAPEVATLDDERTRRPCRNASSSSRPRRPRSSLPLRPSCLNGVRVRRRRDEGTGVRTGAPCARRCLAAPGVDHRWAAGSRPCAHARARGRRRGHGGARRTTRPDGRARPRRRFPALVADGGGDPDRRPRGRPRRLRTDLPPVAAHAVRSLPRADGGALLGVTSARLRGIGVGGTLTFGKTTVRVTGVVADSLVGAAEIVVATDSPLARPTPRSSCSSTTAATAGLRERDHRAMKLSVRFRAPGETPYLRQGDAVLPQALVKARFGEFWYRQSARGRVTIDPSWIADNIVTIDVPGVGKVECHRLIADALRRVLVVAAEHATLAVDFDPQLISPSLGLSRHTWGIGITLHVAPADQPRFIATFAKYGFRWAASGSTGAPTTTNGSVPPRLVQTHLRFAEGVEARRRDGARPAPRGAAVVRLTQAVAQRELTPVVRVRVLLQLVRTEQRRRGADLAHPFGLVGRAGDWSSWRRPSPRAARPCSRTAGARRARSGRRAARSCASPVCAAPLRTALSMVGTAVLLAQSASLFQKPQPPVDCRV